MSDTNSRLKKYYRSIKSWLPCSARQNQQILSKIQNNVAAFLEEKPETSFDEIQMRFGTPQQIAAACVDEMGMCELLHRLRLRKKVLATIRNAALCILAVLVLLVILSVPRVDSLEQVPVATMEKYPALQEAYDELCYQHRYLTVETEAYIQIVTVKNIWGSWERYILPCFGVQTQPVPKNGTADFLSAMHILSPWEEENFFTDLMPLSLTANTVMLTGQGVRVSESFEAIPGHAKKDNQGVIVFEQFRCDRTPDAVVFYLVGTSSGVPDKDQPWQTQATFQWKYVLEIGKTFVYFGDFSTEQSFSVNM